MKKKSIRELSTELNQLKVPTIVDNKPNKFLVLLLRLFGIRINNPIFPVGTLLKRKASDNKNELYEVRANLLNLRFEPVLLVQDFEKNKLTTISDLNITSFEEYRSLAPGHVDFDPSFK